MKLKERNPVRRAASASRTQPDLAISPHLQGGSLEAAGLCARALPHDPADVDLLGEADGSASFDQALVASTDSAETLVRKGDLLSGMGRFEAALECLDKAIALQPGLAAAHCSRGRALWSLKRLHEALASLDRACVLRPDLADACNNRAIVLAGLNRPQDALESFDRALALGSAGADIYNNRGNALTALGRWDEALAAYDEALRRDPRSAAAHCNRGRALRNLKRPAEALESFTSAIALAPDYAEAFNNRGNALTDLDRIVDASSDYAMAIALKPDLQPAHCNHGRVLWTLGRLDEALVSLDRALGLDPYCADAHNIRGNVLADLRRTEQALAAYDRAIELKPDLDDAYWNKSLVLLQLGRFEAGWPLYEWRKRSHGAAARNYDQPLWLGDFDVSEKTLLLYHEQGLGDTLQFCRYIATLRQRCAKLIVVVQQPLLALVRTMAPEALVITDDDPLPPFDCHIPMLSVPLALGATLATIPSPRPYVGAEPELRAKWNARLPDSAKPRIGVVWSGNPGHRNDRHRSIPFETMQPLLGLDACWVSLQKEIRSSEADAVARSGNLLFFGDRLGDFTDTAALIDLMDLIVTVDTSVAHLAGAMGKPVWIMLPFNPDWRWMHDRGDSPWYPSARLFRQDAIGDWTGVMRRVQAELALRFERLSPAAGGVVDRLREADHFNRRGIEFAMRGRLDEAVACLDMAVAQRPDWVVAYVNRGNARLDMDRRAEALADFDAAIALRPDYAPAHCNRGRALWTLHRANEALASFDRAIALNPNHAEAYNNRGAALTELKQAERALEDLDRAIALKPDYAEAHNNRGNARLALARPQAALADYDRALTIRPDFPLAHCNRSAALRALGQAEEALASIDRALALAADYADAHNNRANALLDLGRPHEALTSVDRAIAIRPDFAGAWCNRGLVLAELGRRDEALGSYDRAAALDPELALAPWNKSLVLLQLGKFEGGWPLFEWRSRVHKRARTYDGPRWRGDADVAGRRLLVHAEQGFGDTLQFYRYVGMAASRCAVVVFVVPRELRELLQHLGAGVQVIAEDDPLPPYDVQCPLLSLPLAFGTTPGTIPVNSPRLRADDSLCAQWEVRLPARTKPRVGIAWSGNPAHHNDGNRSIAPVLLDPLLALDVAWVSLHRATRAGDSEILGPGGRVAHFGDQLADFSDTAALIERLDLVITVDTAVAHLAGAMGKPVWIMLPFNADWRWMLDREDSPWHPTARLFRQREIGDWTRVVLSVKAALEARMVAS
jgi:tetratricopeptide (TPR) repeat protein